VITRPDAGSFFKFPHEIGQSMGRFQPNEKVNVILDAANFLAGNHPSRAQCRRDTDEGAGSSCQ
jgi:hypothetical protein